MKPKVTSLAPGDYSHKQSEQLRLREFVWVEITSPPPFPAALVSGPSTRASRGPRDCRYRGTRGPAQSRPWPCRSPPSPGAGVWDPEPGRPRDALPLSPRLARQPRERKRPAAAAPAASAASARNTARSPSSGRWPRHSAVPARASRRAPLQRELRRVARAPQPPWCAGIAPRWPTSPLVGKTGSARVTPPLGWRFHRDVNPQTPEELSLMYFSHCW